MIEAIRRIAGLDTVICQPTSPGACPVVLLHGYGMGPADLSPFAHSLGIDAPFYFPQGPHTVPSGGHAWWSIDEEARAAAVERGPRDLADLDPPSRGAVRSTLESFLDEVLSTASTPRLVLGGFSQGAMLACDTVLHASIPIAGLVMMSASRIAIRDWDQHRNRLRQLPVLVSHGTEDLDLGFSAGERLRDWLMESGASVTWVPFEGGHQIPIAVWRALRTFLRQLQAQTV